MPLGGFSAQGHFCLGTGLNGLAGRFVFPPSLLLWARMFSIASAAQPPMDWPCWLMIWSLAPWPCRWAWSAWTLPATMDWGQNLSYRSRDARRPGDSRSEAPRLRVFRLGFCTSCRNSFRSQGPNLASEPHLRWPAFAWRAVRCWIGWPRSRASSLCCLLQALHWAVPAARPVALLPVG
jgi:hypothetical protein